MDNKYWNKFLQTGKAEDYISYVNDYYNSINQNQVKNEADNEGLNNKGTNNGGE